MGQHWEGRRWDCGDVTQQSTAEDAEKPGKEEERSAACKEALGRFNGTEEWGI